MKKIILALGLINISWANACPVINGTFEGSMKQGTMSWVEKQDIKTEMGENGVFKYTVKTYVNGEYHSTVSVNSDNTLFIAHQADNSVTADSPKLECLSDSIIKSQVRNFRYGTLESDLTTTTTYDGQNHIMFSTTGTLNMGGGMRPYEAKGLLTKVKD